VTDWKLHTSNFAAIDSLHFPCRGFWRFCNKQPKQKMKQETLKIREERKANFLANLKHTIYVTAVRHEL